jgi:hypothetical protein
LSIHTEKSWGFRWGSLLAGLAVLAILAAGVAIRLYDLNDAPLDFHAPRQMHSALIARGMYYATRTDIPDWQRERAIHQQQAEGLIEPQIMETLAAWSYRLVGSADLRIPRLLAIFFWTLGGIGLYLLGRRLVGKTGAILALFLYMLLQYGILASRSFQPDSLMVAAIAWAWWGMLGWQQRPTWKRAILAGLLGGLAIYVKSTAAFFVGGAWLGLSLAGLGLRSMLRSKAWWLTSALLVVPYAAYTLYGTLGLGLLQGQFSLRFFPQMWLDPVFYLQWLLKVESVIPLPWVVLAVLGIFSLPEKSARGLLAGAGLGYLVYGVLFSYYISTHDYYQLPVFPLVALGAGAALQRVLSFLQGPRWLAYAGVTAALAVFGLSQIYSAREALKSVDYNRQVARAEAISSFFSPDDKIVAIAQDYSTRLEYWGWLDVTNWFSLADINLRELGGQSFDLPAYFKQETAGKDFFLITDFAELDDQPQVKAMLAENYPVYRQGDDYLIYDLREAQP